jgi:Response regulators consisting of a CheY-like receiver domain and a winged-helix DNA-binding domain
MKIYIIEDNLVLREELSKLLAAYGYSCDYTDDFEHVISLVEASKPDLILLDINLPYYDGFHICREIRKHSDVPIIIVTSRDTDMDELMGINLGADDFITKPYNKQILLARIGSILKRTKQQIPVDALEYKGLILSLAKSTVTFENQTEELTRNELQILSILIKNAQCIVSREELMEELWQSDEFVDDNTLTVNVNRLRHKLESIGLSEFIRTRRGQGYLI